MKRKDGSIFPSEHSVAQLLRRQPLPQSHRLRLQSSLRRDHSRHQARHGIASTRQCYACVDLRQARQGRQHSRSKQSK
jgi:hypothetical protein